jgi:hypothetical protein
MIRVPVAPARTSIVKFSFPGPVPPIQHRISTARSIFIPPWFVNAIVSPDRVAVTTTITDS